MRVLGSSFRSQQGSENSLGPEKAHFKSSANSLEGNQTRFVVYCVSLLLVVFAASASSQTNKFDLELILGLLPIAMEPSEVPNLTVVLDLFRGPTNKILLSTWDRFRRAGARNVIK